MHSKRTDNLRSARSIGVLLFHDFELLDVFGPLEMYGAVPDSFNIHMVAERNGNVMSWQGPVSVAEHSFDDGNQYDILLVPGGKGTRSEIENQKLLEWIRDQSIDAEYVTSVCTGSALLAKAGVLNGMRATTNKKAFAWVTAQSDQVKWENEARWVEDGRLFTSSGVSAGMDMSLAVIGKILGREKAEEIAIGAEYEWHSDPGWDPFAKIHGLVQ